MDLIIKTIGMAGLLLLSWAYPAKAQTVDAAYIKVTNERAQKIISQMDIADAETAGKVKGYIAEQYQNLSLIHEQRDEALAQVKEQYEGDKKLKMMDKVEKKSDRALAKLHKKYLSQLNEVLTADQVDQVKDGMTYSVAPRTYKVYQEMVPDLSQDQQEQIWSWLVEAREHAMDAGSSHDKHAWFGKYKGKINNYLSDLGVDLKQAEKDMMERQKASTN